MVEGRPVRALALLVALSSAPAGCYAELTGGMYAVTGANTTDWRVAPAFGVSAGVAYDAFVTRASFGGGGEAIHTRVAGADNVVVASPFVARLELSPARIGMRGMFRISAGVSAGPAHRFRTAPDGSGVVEGRPTQAIQGFLMPSTGWIISGGRARNFLVLDVGVGPATFVMWDNPGITNLYGVGGTARLTLSLPLTYNDGIAIGAGIENWAAHMTSPEVQAQVREAYNEEMRASMERLQQQMARDRNNNSNSQSSGCPSGVYYHDSSYNLQCSR